MPQTTSYRSKPAKAETTANLSGDRVLRIVTAKDQSGHLTTRATVATVQGSSLIFALFRDFNETVLRTSLRATDGNVRRQHESVLTTVEQTLRATHFYEVLDSTERDRLFSTTATSTADS